MACNRRMKRGGNREGGNSGGLAPADLLALSATHGLAEGALEAVLIDADAAQTAVAPPPRGDGVAVLVPGLVDGDAALLDVLAVELAEVVAEVVPAVEGVVAAGAARIVARVG